MTNPLIAKWEELNKKKEEPVVEEKYEIPPEWNVRNVTTSNNNNPYGITKANYIPSLITYDPDDLKVSFQQVADKIQQGKAQVASMSMERDVMSIMPNKIIFEVYVDD